MSRRLLKLAAAILPLLISMSLNAAKATLISIKVAAPQASIAIGMTEQFTATGTYSDGSTKNLTSSVIWSSTSPTVASISSAGVAAGKSIGSTTISAASGSISGSSGLQVTAAVLSSITVAPSSVTLSPGQTQQYAATGTYSDGSQANITSAVTWTSSNTAVAIISGSGLSQAEASGTATISATSGSVQGTATLAVAAPKLVSLSVSPSPASISAGASQQFTATGTYSDGSSKNITTTVTWKSSSVKIATISATGLATAVSAGSVTITASAGGGISGKATLTVTARSLVSIAVTPSNPAIPLGVTQQFAATGTYSDGSTQNLTSSVVWSSTNTSVATVSSGGLATPHAVGSTTIRAVSGAISGQTNLSVLTVELVSISVTPTTASIPLGTTQQYTATGTFTDGSTQNLSSLVTWTSSNPTVATIGSTGLASSNTATGTTTISASSGAISSNQASLTVLPAALKSIAVTPANGSIALGTTQQYTATGTFTDGSTQDLTSSVTWSTDNTTIASISSQGLARSVAVGTAHIAATLGSIVGSTSLSVTPAQLVSIAVTPAIPDIPLGTTQQFTATGTYTDGTTQDLTGTVHWSSTNVTVATISNSPGTYGVATGDATGTTTITASSGSVSGSTTLTVSTAELVSIAVSPLNPSIALGTSQQLQASGVYTDSTTQDLTSTATWSSSATTVATVSPTGLAQSVGVGVTTLTASLAKIDGTTSLTVTPAVLVSITVAPSSASIPLGTTEIYSATGTFSDGSTQDLTSTVHWTTSDGTVATISNSAGTAGLVTSAGTGEAGVTATLGSISGTATVTVTPALLVSIAVSPVSPTIPLGKTQQFTAIGTYTDSTTKDITTNVTWTSSSATVAVISNTAGANGLATSSGTGSTQIVAALGGITGSATLTVGTPQIVSIAVMPANPAVSAGSSVTFAATATYTDNSTADVTTSAAWTSSNTSMATVSNAGVAMGVSGGTATITATAGSVQGSTTLTVVQLPTITSFTATPSAITSGGGTTLTAIFSGGTAVITPGNIAVTSGVPVVVSPTGMTIYQLTVTNSAGGSISQQATVNVYGPPVISGFTASPATITIGSSSSLTATFTGGLGVITPGNIAVTSGAPVSVSPTVSTTYTLTVTNQAGTSTQATATVSTLAPLRWAYLNGAFGQILTYSVDQSTGALFPVPNSAQSIGGQAIYGATTPDGRFLYVEATGGLFQFSLDANTGVPAPIAGGPLASSPSNAINDLLFNPAGTMLYTAQGSNLNLYSINQQSGALTLVNSYAGGVNEQAVVSNGAYLYVSSQYAASNQSGITGFSVASDGTLTSLGVVAAAPALTFGLATDPAGTHLLAVEGSNIVVYVIGSDGSLTQSGSYPVGSPAGVTLDPSGRFVYAPSYSSQSLAAFTFDAQSGTLTPIAGSPFQLSVGGAVYSSQVDLSGSYLYVANGGATPNPVVDTFAIDHSSGALTLVSTVKAPGTIYSVDLNAGTAAPAGTLQSLQVSPSTSTLYPGQTLQLTATASYSSGPPLPVSNSASWSSSQSSAAAVDARGIATAGAGGSATITATYGGVSNTATITVPSITSLTINPTTATLQPSGQVQLHALLQFSDGTQEDGSSLVTWSSSNPAAATINASGLATGVGVGSSNITATYFGASSNTAALTVGSLPTASINAPANIVIGTPITLDGSGSKSYNGQALTYLWTLTVPSGSSATLSSTTAAMPVFTPDVIGTFVASLTVNDGTQSSTPATATMTAGYSNGITVSIPALETYSSVTGTVTLSSPPKGTVTINLSSNNPNLVTVDSSVTITAPATSQTFSIQSNSLTGTATITGFQTGMQSGTAVATVSARAMTLAVPPLIRLGGVVSGSLKLADQPGQAITIPISSSAPTIASVVPPGTANFAKTDVGPVSFMVAGSISGAATISAAFAGYTTATASVVVTSTQLVQLATGITVAPGHTVSLPVSLSQAAPVGGVFIYLSSDSSALATPSPICAPPAPAGSACVFVPAGATTPSTTPQITGVAFGTANITAVANGYAPDTEAVNVAYTVSITPSPLSVAATSVQNATVSLSAPPPSGSPVTLNLSTDDATVATVPAQITVPSGNSSVQVPVSGIAIGTTTLHVSGTGVTAATDTINVTAAPAINLGTLAVGLNLETSAHLQLASNTDSNLTVTLSSSDPSQLLLAKNPGDTGSQQIEVEVQAGQAQASYYIQGLAGTGAPTITASAAGYADTTATVTLNPAGFVFSPATDIATTTASPNTALTIEPAMVVSGGSTAQLLRPGFSVSVSVNSSVPSVGGVVAPVTFNGGDASQSALFQPLSGGTTLLTIAQPAGFTGAITSSLHASVTSVAGFIFSPVTVGQNLETAVNGNLSIAAPAGNLRVTLTVANGGSLLLSPDGVTPGLTSIMVEVPAGSTQIPTFYVEGLNQSGTFNVNATAASYEEGTLAVAVAPSGFVLVEDALSDYAPSFTTTAYSGPTQLRVLSAYLDPSTLALMGLQPLSPDAPSVSVTIDNSGGTVGFLTSNSLQFSATASGRTTTFQPQQVGTSTISLETPAGFATPSNYQQLTANVVPSSLGLTIPTLGKDLEGAIGVNLGGPAPPGDETITLTSSDPSKLLLSTDPNQIGSTQVSVLIFAGQSSSSTAVYAQSLVGSGTAAVTATSTNFGDAQATVNFAPSGPVLYAPSAYYLANRAASGTIYNDLELDVWMHPLDPDTKQDTDQTYPQYLNAPFAPANNQGQLVRPSVSMTVDLASGNAGVGVITTTPVTINPGSGFAATFVHPLSIGTTVASINPPSGAPGSGENWTQPSNYQSESISLASAALSLSPANVGKNLEVSGLPTMSPPAPDDTVVTLTSSDPSKLTLSTDPSTAGGSSVTVTIPAGFTYPYDPITGQKPIYMQALSDNGQVTVTATAAGISSALAQITLTPAGFAVWQGGFCGSPNSSLSTYTYSQPSALTVTPVSLDPVTGNANLCVPEMVGPGSQASVNLSMDAPGIGTLSPNPFVLTAGQSSGYVYFQPQAAGAVNVTINTPAGFSTASNLQSVAITVQKPPLTIGAQNQNLGLNLEMQGPIYLPVPVPADEQITITSSDPSKVAFSADPTVAGTASLILTIPAGSSSVQNLWMQGLAQGAVTVTATSTSTNLVTSTFAVNVVPAGAVIQDYYPFTLDQRTLNTTPFAGDLTLSVCLMPLDPTTLNSIDVNYCWNGGAESLSPTAPNSSSVVSVNSQDTSVGTILTTPLTFTPGTGYLNTTFHPVGLGTTQITMSQATGLGVASNYQSLTATVTSPQLSISPVAVGQSLQTSWSVCASAASSETTVQLSISPTGFAKLSASSDTGGGDNLTLAIGGTNGTCATFWVQGIKSTNITPPPAVVITAQGDSFQDATPASVTVNPSGFVLPISQFGNQPNFFTTTTSADQTLTVAPGMLDPVTLNLIQTQLLNPNVNVSVSVYASNSCGGTNGSSTGTITLSSLPFSGVSTPQLTTSFHVTAGVATPASAVIYIPAAAGFSRASDNNCITANVTQ